MKLSRRTVMATALASPLILRTVRAAEKSFAGGSLGIAEVNGPGIKAGNDFGKTEVSTQSRTAKAQGETVQHRFPGHSFTQLTARLA